MKYSLGNVAPELRGGGHFIAPNAAVIGHVIMEADTSVWFSAVVRGDNEPIHIGAGSNLQDGCVCHSDEGSPLVIGRNVTVGHQATLHGCSIGDGTLVGINAVVLNNAKIGKNCVIAANSLVPEGMEVPDGSLVMGAPAKIKRTLTAEQQAFFSQNARHYVDNSERFKTALKPVED